jgi:hypothetical protein
MSRHLRRCNGWKNIGKMRKGLTSWTKCGFCSAYGLSLNQGADQNEELSGRQYKFTHSDRNTTFPQGNVPFGKMSENADRFANPLKMSENAETFR